MKRLHWFVLRTYLGPMFMTFFIVMFILLMQFLWLYLDDLVGKGLELGVILELMLYASAGLTPMAFPLATLLASLMTMGKLGENNELLAMKASGISLPRMMAPLFILSICIMGIAFLMADSVVPVATLKMRTMIYSMQRKRPDLVIQPGVFYNDIGNYSIRVESRDPDSRLLRDVMIYDHSQGGGNIRVTRADSGYISFTKDQSHIIIELYEGVLYEEIDRTALSGSDETNYAARQVHFDFERLVQPLDGFGFQRADEELFKETYHVMNTRQLKKAADSLHVENEERLTNYVQSVMQDFFVFSYEQDTIPPTDTLQMRELYAASTPQIRKESIIEAIESAQSLKSQAQSFHSDYFFWCKHARRHLVELHRKYTLSVACLVFFLIGAPLGAIIRKGGLGMPVVVSVLFFVAYYVVSLTGEKFAKQLIHGVVRGMWGSTFLLLPIAAFLIYKTTTDSALFRAEWYKVQWHKLTDWLRAKRTPQTPEAS